jgi:hypothetical protein
VKVQLVEVAGGFIDPIHVTSARTAAPPLRVRAPDVIKSSERQGLDEPF